MHMLLVLLVFGNLFASSLSFFTLSSGSGASSSGASIEEVNQQLQTSLLQLEQFFQSPIPAARYVIGNNPNIGPIFNFSLSSHLSFYPFTLTNT